MEKNRLYNTKKFKKIKKHKLNINTEKPYYLLGKQAFF